MNGSLEDVTTSYLYVIVVPGGTYDSPSVGINPFAEKFLEPLNSMYVYCSTSEFPSVYLKTTFFRSASDVPVIRNLISDG